MNRYSILCTLLLQGFILRPEVGCMDNSKYLDTRDGYDYKKYHYVFCTCPCDRYYHSQDRGLCEQCMHYRAPKDIQWGKWRSTPEYE